MNSIQELWNKRMKEYWNMAIRYLRLIGNSGFLFTIYLAIIVGSYYYSELLKWLPEGFPAAIFLALVTSILLTKSPLRTFLKEGDIVFLSPVEGRLANYFRASFFYSLLVQSFVIVLVIVLLTPLYRHFIVDDANVLVFVVIVLFISKAWNLLVQWEEARLQFRSSRTAHIVLRFFVNGTLSYLLYVQATIYFIIAVLGLKAFLLLFYYLNFKKRHSLKWDYLIDVEERMVMSFYRIANMFTDVPKLSTKVKGRRVLSSLTKFLSHKEENVYSYLYLKSFIRANDYFGIYTRLLVIGIVLLFYVQVNFGAVFVGLLISYMSLLQLSTLWNHHRLKLWVDLYPISMDIRMWSFSKVLFSLILVKVIIFTMTIFIATNNIVETTLLFTLGIIVSYVYSFVIFHRKSKRV